MNTRLRAVSGIIAVIFVGGIAFCGVKYYQQRANEAASSAYIEALQPVEEERGVEDKAKWTEAQKKLIAAAQKYSSSGVAPMADIFAGHVGLELKDPKQAIELYSQAVKKLGDKDDLYPLALIGLGYSYEANAQPAEALKQFAAVTELKQAPSKDLALWESARLAHEIKDDEKAKTFVTRLLEEFPASTFERSARQLKDSL
jgi:tetratricopeptide (TPR) repeat protein